jgi:hypothetical protein
MQEEKDRQRPFWDFVILRERTPREAVKDVDGEWRWEMGDGRI